MLEKIAKMRTIQRSGFDEKWRVMNREAICLQLADKINHLKNNDKIISERLAGIRLLYGVEPGPRTGHVSARHHISLFRP